MSLTIRALRPTDLPRICELYELVFRSGTRQPPPQLAGYFERTLLDHPWADPEIPSLVGEESDGTVVGFLGSHARRLRVDGRGLRLGGSGPLLTDPAPRHRGVGALLLRRYLRGPQDLSLTDGATATVHRMWTALGGREATHASLSWTRVLRPAAGVHALLGQRERWTAGQRLARRLGPPLDAVATRLVRKAPPPPGRTEELTVEVLLEQVAAHAARLRVRLDYDEPYLRWVFAELDALTVRGTPIGRLVLDAHGRAVGWFLYFHQRHGVCEVLQVAAPGGDPGLVLDHLFQHAREHGAAAVSGRVEPHLAAALRGRRLLLSHSAWALVHSDDPALHGLLTHPQALLTRLDGEYWMGPHLLWR